MEIPDNLTKAEMRKKLAELGEKEFVQPKYWNR